MANQPQQHSNEGRPRESVREVLISIVISFAMAFVFRSFVVEPFMIPTGSMAPTLLGAHVQARSPLTGDEWAINPRDYVRGTETPLPVQGSDYGPINVTDPHTGPPANRRLVTSYRGEGAGILLSHNNMPLQAGDRILVLKHIYALRAPRRWEIIVFKSPETPKENFIKRLVGLPGEQLRIVDGDIFTRPINSESEDDWTIERKPDRVQRTLWRTLFSSEFTPITQLGQQPDWSAPWVGDGWDEHDAAYTFTAADSVAASLRWDAVRWPVTDWEPYNELLPQRGLPIVRFPVGDVRVRAGVEPASSDFSTAVTITARSEEFQATIASGTVTLQMRHDGTDAWTELASGPGVAWRPGHVHNIEVWHFDQTLELWIDGARKLRATYDWDAAERLRNSIPSENPEPSLAQIVNPGAYTRTQARFNFAGEVNGLKLHRVGLDRDLYHQAGRSRGRPGALRAVTEKTSVTLNKDEFFVLGDNSPASRDARMWDHVNPWIADQIDDKIGVVNRRLIMGKAFFVYWPARYRGAWGLPIPDFGRMRFVF